MIPHARDYTAWGLRIRCELPVPFAAAAGDAPGTPDVTVRLGAVPEALEAPRDRRGRWESAPGVFLLKVDGVARYLVTAGRDVVVEPAGGDESAVTAFLPGSVMAACLQQRGIVTLHASAVEIGGGAALFAGASGSGKSTLLAALVDRGYPMLADDVTGVVLDDGGRPTALPAFPCVRLWADAVDALGWRERTRGRVRDELDKQLAPVDLFHASPLPVRAVFALASHNRDEFRIDGSPAGDAFHLLLGHTYRRRFLRGLARRPEHFRVLAAMARRVPVTSVTRPAHPYRLGALADEIERRLPAADGPREGGRR